MTEEPRIIVAEVGVALVDARTGAAEWSVRWADVKQIVAWKDDAFAFDIICIGFQVQGEPDAAEEPRYYRCDEEQPGWKELLEALERMFGVRVADWWQSVAFPAFAGNATVLWDAPSHGQAE